MGYPLLLCEAVSVGVIGIEGEFADGDEVAFGAGEVIDGDIWFLW